MSQNNKLRFYHTDDLDSDISTWREVYPVGPKKYEWKKDKKEVFYRFFQKGGYTFINDKADGIEDFNYFNSINNDFNGRCVTRYIVAQENCNGTWSTFHIGKFTMNNGKFDLDKCKIDVDQDIVDVYSCFKENGKENYNILNSAPNISVYSPVQNNFDFVNCRNKEWLENPSLYGGLPCDGTGGWKKFYTKVATNIPSPRSTIYNDSAGDVYIGGRQTKKHAFWVKKVLAQYFLEIYRFADNQLISYSVLDSNSIAEVDKGMVCFTSNNKRNFYTYRPDKSELITVVSNHPDDIIWVDCDDELNKGYAFFYDSNNILWAYDHSTGILRIIDNVDISTETATLVPTLNVSYGDGLLAYHDDSSKDLMRYDPETFTLAIVENVNNVKFICSEDSFLTWFNIDNQYMNLQNRDDTTFEVILLRENVGDSRYFARENEWLVFDDSNDGGGAQLVFNLITLASFVPAVNGAGAYIPTNLVYKIENGWFLQGGQTLTMRAVFLDSRIPNVINAWYYIDLVPPIQVTEIASPHLQISAGIERIYVSGKSSTGGYPRDFEIWSVDMKDNTSVMVENLGPETNPNNENKRIYMNNHEQVFTLNENRIKLYKENIQRNDELTVWFREKIKTICVGSAPTTPGAGWYIYQNQCNQFGTSTWVREPTIAVPPTIDIKEGGCLCDVDLINGTGCGSVDPNGTIIDLLMLPNTSFTTPQIRGFTETKQPFGGGVVEKTWYIENPRDGSTYTWAFPTIPGYTIVSGQGTPIITVRFSAIFSTTNIECQETNPCSAGVIPLATIPFTVKLWSSPWSGSCFHNIPSTYSVDTYSGGIAVFIGASTALVSGASSHSTVQLPDGRYKTTAVHDGVSANVSFSMNLLNCAPVNVFVPIVLSPTADVIVTPLEVCPNGLQTYSIPMSRPNCTYQWSVDAPCFIVGPITGDSVVVDMNGASGTEFISAFEVCPLTPINYKLIAECSDLHNDSWWWIVGQDIKYENSRLLKNVVEDMVKSICPKITGIRSDFFQWNPINPSLINYVYGGINQYNYLTISQKSDIKDPNAAEKATIGNLTWEQFIGWLRNIEVYYIVIDNEVYFEHISRFSNSVGLDLTQGKYIEFAKYQNRFSYAKAEMSRREEYHWMEALNADFVGFPIEYKNLDGTYSLCVNDKTESHDFDGLTTDLKFIQTSPSEIDNDGFVILANTFDGVDYNVIQDIGLIGGVNILNSPMSIAILQDRFLRYNRVLPFGNMNRVYTIFESSQYFKKQEKFKIPLCCNVEFDPADLVRTDLGEGEIESAEIDYENDMLDIKLKYE